LKPLLFGLLFSTSALGIQVPADVGIGPQATWFIGPLYENRGSIPHFGIRLNIEGVLDKEWLQNNANVIPAQYRSMVSGATEIRIGASIFIPRTLYISPNIDALNSIGMYGIEWAPVGITFVNTGMSSGQGWRRSETGGQFMLSTHVILTYIYVHSPFAAVPSIHFLRPGISLEATVLLAASKSFLISLGGGANIWIPQRMGTFIEFGPINEAMWLAPFAFLKFHTRFPYEAKL
jgi:hypothetical protein